MSSIPPEPTLSLPSSDIAASMAGVPTQIHTHLQDAIDSSNSQHMRICLAIQALVQNQVDLILKETYQTRFTNWKHEDHRSTCTTVRSKLNLKKNLLKEYPGLLSGPQAVSLRDDDWTPSYIISACILSVQLQVKVHNSNLRVCNIIWRNETSGATALTFYNNHLDPMSSFRHVITKGLSTYRTSKWTLGRRGLGFIRAAHHLMGVLKEGLPISEARKSHGMDLRVGHTVGEFYWQGGLNTGCAESLVLKEEDLTPLSLKNVEGRPDFQFAYDTKVDRTLGASKHTRVQAIYSTRHRYKLSEKRKQADTRATEPTDERSFVEADEVVVTVRGLSGALTPEYLFSGIYSIFPPEKQWPICLSPSAHPIISFFTPSVVNAGLGVASVPQSTQGRFYYRDHLVANVPIGFSKIGINYFGILDASSSGLEGLVPGNFSTEFQQHLFEATDTAIRTHPDLSVGLAEEFLVDASSLPNDCGMTLRTEGRDAYRTAFETAWQRLNPQLANHPGGVYPYVASLDTAEEDKALIVELKMYPIPVHPRIRLLLMKSGAYPPIRVYAESLLLSAYSAPHLQQGTDVLRAALRKLFPESDLAADPLSVRQYTHSYPRVVWDEETRIFVMASSLASRCPAHLGDASDHEGDVDRDERPDCLCWLLLALSAAVASWQSKKQGADPMTVSPSDEQLAHILLDCFKTAMPVLRTVRSTPRDDDAWEKTARDEGDDDDDDALSYLNESEGQAAQAEPPTQSGDPETPTAPPSRSTSAAYPSPVSLVLPRTWALSGARSLSTAQSRPGSVMAGANRSQSAKKASERNPKDSPATIYAEARKTFKKMTSVGRLGDAAIMNVKAAYEKESAALREELAQERARSAALGADLATVKKESKAALASRDETISQRDESVRALTARLKEKTEFAETQTLLAQDQTRRIRELEDMNTEWTSDMKVLKAISAKWLQSPSPRLTNDAHIAEEENGPRKKPRLTL
ncbi:hypothetical protein BD310DRAFT_923899 [Dichomitus squalens]|uniref:Uncharacterized protein n=1 Tax=Dichomitus squalens TaxID=114155 RepID=A0A4Q9PZW1_9APHY|nr:hypothetical protein BD310DRAFT_923899 [Dichomitus squalens]